MQTTGLMPQAQSIPRDSMLSLETFRAESQEYHSLTAASSGTHAVGASANPQVTSYDEPRAATGIPRHTTGLSTQF